MQKGDQVKITSGPWADHTGTVTRKNRLVLWVRLDDHPGRQAIVTEDKVKKE